MCHLQVKRDKEKAHLTKEELQAHEADRLQVPATPDLYTACCTACVSHQQQQPVIPVLV